MKKLFSKLRFKIRYFFKIKEFKRCLNDFPKLIEVVLSCETEHQCDAAMKYVGFYLQQRNLNSPDNPFNECNNLVLSQLVKFLQDTRAHSIFSFHHDENNEIQKTWPDLNDYLKDLIGVRFTKVWSRHRSSVIGVIENG